MTLHYFLDHEINYLLFLFGISLKLLQNISLTKLSLLVLRKPYEKKVRPAASKDCEGWFQPKDFWHRHESYNF